jgi:hypothetical protein
MIKVVVHNKKWNWTIHAFFAVNEYHVDEIMELLWMLDCDARMAQKAYSNLSSGELDNGLCYSNYRHRETVFVVAKTSSADEFANSLYHELTHLQAHFCETLHLRPTGEDVAYFTGEFIREIYPKIKHLLCDCCRTKKEKDYGKE